MNVVRYDIGFALWQITGVQLLPWQVEILKRRARAKERAA